MPHLLPASLRARLLLLLLFAVLPPMALMGAITLKERGEAARAVEADALRLARAAASHHDRLIEGAHQLLSGLARLPQVRSRDARACNALFATVLSEHAAYAAIAAADSNGSVFARDTVRAGPASIADRDWFKRVRRTHAFAVGEYENSPMAGGAGLVCADPVLTRAGAVQAVVFVSIDLGWLQRVAAEFELPREGAYAILDRGGAVLARFPDPEEGGGRSIAGTSLMRAIGERGEGTVEAAGPDGVVRLYAFAPAHSAPDRGVVVVVGLSKSVTFARAQRTFMRSLALLAVFATLLLLIAWRGVRLIVLRRVDALVAATRRLAAGERGVRSGLPYGRSELSDLTRAFDEMAAALEQSRAERERYEEALRHLSMLDDLTGLFNRRGFVAFADQRFKMADRARTAIMLLFVDLDGLKEINDTLGHAEGDRALVEVARALRETVREADVVARIGGDEFAVLAFETSRPRAERITMRLTERLEGINRRPGRRHPISISVGRSIYDPERPCSVEDLLAEGDSMMYEQKRAKRAARAAARAGI